MELINTSVSELTFKKGPEPIPRDWKLLRLKDVAPLQRGFDLISSNIERGSYPVVYSNGIVNYHSKFMVRGPGVVTGRSGTIGKVNYLEGNYWPHNTSLWVTDFKDNFPLFIYYLYHFIGLERFGTGSGVPTLNRNDVHDFKIALPPTLNEQHLIATALSDTDALISSLEKLITKKKAIKQGAMQQLLTGKKRLPGFSGKWEVKNLGELCQIFGRIGFRGYTVNDIVIEGNGAITISPSNIQDNKIDFKKCTYISWFKYEESPEIKIYNGDVLLVKTGSTFGKTALVKNLPIAATINPQLVVLKNIIIDKYFLAYLMSFESIQNQIKTTIVGGAIPTLSQQVVSNFKVWLPTSKAEQSQIAHILCDMDDNIEALETKMHKYKSLKQGMMQELLTGKTRLI